MTEEFKFGAVVTGLNDYIDQVGKGDLIKAIAGSAPSIKYFAEQAGVNQVTDIHLMEVSGAFGDGKNCTLNDNTNFTFTDRQLDPAIVKQEVELCKAELWGKWLAYNDRITASAMDEVPFEGAMLEAFKENVAENLENWLWNGGTIGSKTYDGFAGIIEKDGTDLGTATSVYDAIVKLIKGVPAKSRKATEIFVDEDTMLALKEELLAKDFRLFDLTFTNGAIADEHTIKMPVFGTLVHEVSGLAGAGKAYALVPAHAVYGYSVKGDNADIVSVYDAVSEKTIIRARLVVATQIAYPVETAFIALP